MSLTVQHRCVIATIITLCQVVFSSAARVEIVSSNSICSNPGQCFTLVSCLQNLSSCLFSNSVVEFSPEDHFTGDLTGFPLIRNVQNLTLKVKTVDSSVSESTVADIHCLKKIGFAFFNVLDLSIIGLQFHDCGSPISRSLHNEAIHSQTETYYHFFDGTKIALFLVNIYNLNIRNFHVNNSDGYGLFIINALGRSSILNSHFSYNNYKALQYHQFNPMYCNASYVPNITTCTGGNLVVLYQDEPWCHQSTPEYVLVISDCTFSHGVNFDYVSSDPPPDYVYNSGGLSIFTGQVTYSLTVQVQNVLAYNNIGHNGANAVVYMHDLKGVDILVHIDSSTFKGGNRELEFSSNVAYAGGIYVYYGNCACEHSQTWCSRHRRADRRNFVISNSTFVDNHGFHGAAILLTSVIDDENLNGRHELAEFYIYNCTIVNNTGYVGIVKVTETRTSADSAYQLMFFLSRTVVSSNNLMDVIHGNIFTLPERSFLSTVGVFGQFCRLSNNSITFNSLVGLHFERNEVDFHEDSYIIGNNVIGGFGGGMRIYHGAIIRLWSDCSLVIADNKADLGGGIYVDHIFKSNKQPCFFDIGRRLSPGTPNRIKFRGNKAKLAGNSIYGGHIENCTLLSSFNLTGLSAFPVLFQIPWNNSLTEVTSQVKHLCFCDYGLPSCNHRDKQVEIIPGQEIVIPVVAVGQLEGTLPSIVLSDIVRSISTSALGAQQDVQQLSVTCGDIHYQIKALENSSMQINLQASDERQQNPTQSLSNALKLYVNITSCPVGFVQKSENYEEGCECIMFLKERGVTCYISDLSFELVPPLWIGYDSSNGLILAHDSCPFDYCNTSVTRFKLNDSDVLCQFKHSGVLCGGCLQGLSVVFGSSKCKHCSNAYVALILVFLIAGFMLVLTLIYLDLTVADGTLNGLIFYANIVRMHHAIIFPAGHTNVITVLIAWLNLDLGIEVCFYDGFDAHTRTWLQYFFPVYIWVIIILIIVLGWYLTVVARIVGSNSIPVLATLLLMSYTKLQRTILESLSFTKVDSQTDQVFYIWLYDGNVSYSATKHIFLILTAFLFAIGFIIPFTFIVLCGPLLQMKCTRFMLKFKLTAINDAYQGPYKTKYRWWTGIMLLVRTLLILFFSANILGNQRLNLLFVVSVCVVVLAFMWNVGTVYKDWRVNVIESFFVANLTLLAAWCEYNRQQSTSYVRDQSIIAYVLVGSALLLFVGIALTRVILRVKSVIVKRVFPKFEQMPLEDIPAPAAEGGMVAPPNVTCTYINFQHSESEMEK